jgi:hypothetical protein
MAVNWKSVKAEHMTRACELTLEERGKHVAAKGIVITFDGQRLPAKHVVRLAYCLANGLPNDSKLKFSSGEGTVNLIKKLGFVAERARGDIKPDT